MSVSAETLRKLATLSLSSEQMAGVLDILAGGLEADEARKAAQRERTRKAREKQRNVTTPLQSRDSHSDDTHGGVTRVEDKTSNLEIEPQGKKVSKEVARRTRFPIDLPLPAEWFQWALERGLPAVRIPIEFEKMANWAANAPASKSLKSDWFKAWQNWVIGAIDALPQNRAPPASQAAPSMSQLLTAIRDHPHENQPGSAEDRSGFRAAIPHLRAVGAG